MKAAITGHRKFSDKTLIKWIQSVLLNIVITQDISYGYTCLAPGADEMFAATLRVAQVKYTALIPCQGYEKTFTKSQINHYKASLSNASRITTLNFSIPEDRAFYAASKNIVNKADILIAVWDGKKAKGLGGTADIVAYALSNDKKVIHINTQSKKVIKLN